VRPKIKDDFKLVNVNFRHEKSKQDIIKSLISAGTFDSLTHFYRTAADELLAKYTKIPTLLSLDRRVNTNKGLIDKLNEEKRELNRRLTEIETELEANRG